MARGPSILVLSGLALGVGSAAALVLAPNLTEALRWIIRGTARSSFALFLLAFIAAPLHSLWPGPAFAGLLRSRRLQGRTRRPAIGLCWCACFLQETK